MSIYKPILFAFIFCTVFYSTFSQEDVLRPNGRPHNYYSNYNGSDDYEKAPWYFGVEAGLNFNFFSQKIQWTDAVPDAYRPTSYDNLTSGFGLSPHIGVMVDIPITKTLGVEARLSYDSKYFRNKGNGSDFNSISGAQLTTTVDWNVTADYLTFTPLLRGDIDKDWFFTIGPTFHFLIGDVKPNVDYTPYLNAPINSSWNPYIKSSLSSITQKSTRIGIEGGIGYKYQINPKIYLVPQARFQLMLTPNYDDFKIYSLSNYNDLVYFKDRMQHSIQFALAVWFEL